MGVEGIFEIFLDFRDFPGFSGFFDFLLGFWGPGGIPLDSEGNFDQSWGREAPGTFFWTRFGHFLRFVGWFYKLYYGGSTLRGVIFLKKCTSWILQAFLWGVHPPGGHVFEKMHLLEFTSFTMGGPPSRGSFFWKMTPFGIDLLRRKRRAAQFRAGYTDSQAEINFLGLFRER